MKIKHLKHQILLLALGLSLFSCKKNTVTPEDSANPFPVTVYPTSYAAKYSMRMFVGGVEITDPGKITKFVANMPASLTTTDLLSKFPASYTFTSADSLKFSANNNFFVSKTNNRYVITAISNSAVNPVNPLLDVDKYFVFQTTSKPAVSGFDVTRQFAAYGNYAEFKVSVLNYKYRRPLTNNLTAWGLITNEFDPATVTKLGPSDTLAVQEFFITYK